MHRLLPKMSMAFIAAMALGFASVSTQAQQVGTSTAPAADGTAQLDAEFPSRPELLRQIALYEAAEKSAERAHPGFKSMVKLYSNLAGLYEEAGMYSRSEETMHREIALLRNEPEDELADAIGHLATVHVAMGELRQAEKEDMESLRIRESLDEPAGTARSWVELADVYVKERQFKKALEYAQKAMPILADDPKVNVVDRIAVRQTLAFALCGVKQCGPAVQLLKDALEMEKVAYGPDSLLVGSSYFGLGYAYWQNGDMDTAAELMARGVARMKVDLGWGHRIYLNAMMEYARFLRQRGQMELAASAEREVKMANAMVDVRSLAPSISTFAAR